MCVSVWVCVTFTPRRLFPGRRGEDSGCGVSRLPLPCHKQRDISRRCRNQQRGGQSGRLPPECSETTPAWIFRYNPGQASANPRACPPTHPDSLRPVAVRWVIASRPGPQPRSLSIYLPPLLPPVRISPSPLLSSSQKNAPLPHLSPFFSRPRAPLSPLSFRNRHAFASNPTDTSVPLLLSEIATALFVFPPSTRAVQPPTPSRPSVLSFSTTSIHPDPYL